MASFDASSTTSVTTQSSRASSIQSDRHLIRPHSPSHLRPEDAYSPPSKGSRRPPSPLGRSDTLTASNLSGEHRKRRSRPRNRSRSRRRGIAKPAHPRPWKKLLWVKQSYPDNYTDEETFLNNLQRNPRLRPYEFWPLVADSTIIVQHVCSVAIFVSCFTAIFQERVGPSSVVGLATFGTVGGWVVREVWRWQEDGLEHQQDAEAMEGDGSVKADVDLLEGRKSDESATGDVDGFHLDITASSTSLSNGHISRPHSRNPSSTSIAGLNTFSPGSSVPDSPTAPPSAYAPSYYDSSSSLSPRMQEYLTTFKSATLIYCALLGLSPILKSLTKSTSSDSIWALSTWLLAINIFTFDYGAGPESKFPAPLSTNAALMASTVLASRLPSTSHVFGLTLFSIEIFGLFPVFRRHLRAQSETGHLLLTVFLVVCAAGGLASVIVGPTAPKYSKAGELLSAGGGIRWGWTSFGVIVGLLLAGLVMGMTSWWLIGLQRYKNEIRGPWDPARPVIRGRGWD